MIFSPDLYQKAIRFAAQAHGSQTLPGSQIPYMVHLANVATEIFFAATQDEFDVDFAMVCSLLHDTLEDTNTSVASIQELFGENISQGIQALTKNLTLPKEQRMQDSLDRILKQPKEVAIVKLADRITNLQPPPHYWSIEKRIAYQQEACLILNTLGNACKSLAKRLLTKVEAYSAFFQVESIVKIG